MHPPLYTSLFTESDLSPAELSAARLDGELFSVGFGFACVAEPETRELRALALGAEMSRGAVAELQTALWIYGCVPRAPSPHRLCLKAYGTIRATSTAHAHIREVSLRADEVQFISEVPVTTPLRTLLDVARISEQFTALTEHQLAHLVRSARLTLVEAEEHLALTTHLPHKKRVLHRLQSVFAEGARQPIRSAGQPPLTRYTS